MLIITFYFSVMHTCNTFGILGITGKLHLINFSKSCDRLWIRSDPKRITSSWDLILLCLYLHPNILNIIEQLKRRAGKPNKQTNKPSSTIYLMSDMILETDLKKK